MKAVISKERRVFIAEFGDCYDISESGVVRSHYYNASNKNVKSIKKRVIPKVLKTRMNSKGKYLYVRMGFDLFGQKKRNKSIHRLVASCFLDNYSELLEVNHNDGDRMNNHYTNLSMVTRQENMAHAWRTGLVRVAYGVGQSHSKLTEDQVFKIFKSNLSPAELSNAYNICRRQVWAIRSGRSWGHLTNAIK